MKRALNEIIFCILFLALLPLTGLAETIDNRFFYPNILERPLPEHATGIVLTAQREGVRTGTVWRVFTAQNGVTAFSNANRTGNQQTFDMLESFVVIEETANQVRAVLESYVDQVTLLDGYRNNAWWFNKENMLLWNNCLVQPNVVVGEHFADFNRRAMVINQLEMTVDAAAMPGFFNSPDLNATLLAESRSFDILFVYHEKNDYLLLAESPSFSSHNVKNRIRGWVSRQYLSEWNHHLTLERNWEMGSRPAARVYSDISDAMSFQASAEHTPTAPGRIILNESTIPSQRLHGEENRLFVLTEGIDMSEQYPKLGVVGEVRIDQFDHIESGCLPHPIPPERIAWIRAQVSRGIAAAQQVNVVFVVDATTSMEIYSEPIIDALETTMTRIMQDSRERELDIQYNLAALVFRDEGEPYAYEVSNFGNYTDDIGIMRAFFSEAMDPSKNTGANPTHPEALYHGMHRAVEVFRPDPLSTNYMILIGDAGDNPTSYTPINQQSVINILDEYNFNLLAYQIHHVTHITGAYDAYRVQVGEIIEELSLRRNKALYGEYDQYSQTCPDIRIALDPIFGQLPTTWPGFEVDNSLAYTTINKPKAGFTNIAQLYFPEYGDESISTSEFGEMLRRDLTEIPQKLEEFLEIVVITGEGVDDQMYTLSIIFFGLQLGMSMEDILILIFQFNEMYQEGYSAYLPAWMGNNALYQYAALINHNDAIGITEFFSRIVPGGTVRSIEALRRNIQRTWERILVEDLQLVPRNDFHDLTIAQNITYLTGLPSPELFKQYRNADLVNPERLPDKILMTLCIDLIITMGHLNSITEGQNIMNRGFFESYFSYIDIFLEEMDVPNDNPRQLLTNLGQHYGSQDFANYPKKSLNPLRPTARQYWYYWVDARHMASEIHSPSTMVLEFAERN